LLLLSRYFIIYGGFLLLPLSIAAAAAAAEKALYGDNDMKYPGELMYDLIF
jgi:hypothetical protein